MYTSFGAIRVYSLGITIVLQHKRLTCPRRNIKFFFPIEPLASVVSEPLAILAIAFIEIGQYRAESGFRWPNEECADIIKVVF